MIYSRNIGDCRVTNVIEYCGPTHPPAMAFPGCDPEVIQRNSDWLDNNHYFANIDRFVIAIQMWIVHFQDRVILIDAGVGNAKDRTGIDRMHMLNTLVPLWFEAAGAGFDQVTDVVMTHLHVDHVGWNTVPDGKGGWQLAFPNAQYHLPAADLDHFRSTPYVAKDPGFDDSVQPVLDSGRYQLVQPGDCVADVLHAELAPGHTPGQLIYWLGEPEGDAVFSADIFHHPIQITEPQINSAFCSDPDAARSTRRAFLDRVSESGALIMPCHFGAPHCGHARKQGDGFRFEPAAFAAAGKL
ncbi:MAG: MBL fold metallo-hydrolase [Thalassovita sp.]